jgi:hypothetical protein
MGQALQLPGKGCPEDHQQKEAEESNDPKGTAGLGLVTGVDRHGAEVIRGQMA